MPSVEHKHGSSILKRACFLHTRKAWKTFLQVVVPVHQGYPEESGRQGFRQKYSDDTAFRRQVMALSTLAYPPLPYVVFVFDSLKKEFLVDALPIVEYFEHTHFGTDRVNSRHPNAWCRGDSVFRDSFAPWQAEQWSARGGLMSKFRMGGFNSSVDLAQRQDSGPEVDGGSHSNSNLAANLPKGAKDPQACASANGRTDGASTRPSWSARPRP